VLLIRYLRSTANTSDSLSFGFQNPSKQYMKFTTGKQSDRTGDHGANLGVEVPLVLMSFNGLSIRAFLYKRSIHTSTHNDVR